MNLRGAAERRKVAPSYDGDTSFLPAATKEKIINELQQRAQELATWAKKFKDRPFLSAEEIQERVAWAKDFLDFSKDLDQLLEKSGDVPRSVLQTRAAQLNQEIGQAISGGADATLLLAQEKNIGRQLDARLKFSIDMRRPLRDALARSFPDEDTMFDVEGFLASDEERDRLWWAYQNCEPERLELHQRRKLEPGLNH